MILKFVGTSGYSYFVPNSFLDQNATKFQAAISCNSVKSAILLVSPKNLMFLKNKKMSEM
jgi:hypothetical protein